MTPGLRLRLAALYWLGRAHRGLRTYWTLVRRNPTDEERAEWQVW